MNGARPLRGPSVASDSDPDAGPRCNIGPAEIERRRRIAAALSVMTVLLAGLLLALPVPHLTRALVWPFAAGTAVTWLQVSGRFCVRFGLAGLENLGPLGAERRVAEPQLRDDRRRALELIGLGLLAGLVVTVGIIVLPL